MYFLCKRKKENNENRIFEAFKIKMFASASQESEKRERANKNVVKSLKFIEYDIECLSDSWVYH